MSREKLIAELRQIILEDYGLTMSGEQAFLIGKQLTDVFEKLIFGEEVEINETKKSRAEDSVENYEK